MPLNGSGVASKPSGTTAVAGATIESAKFNSVIDDIYSSFNTARPIAYGGTGASNPSDARTALGLAIGSDVQAYDAALASLAGLSFVSGDILYATAANTLARLAKGTDGQVLALASGAPAWATPTEGGITTETTSTVNSGTTFTVTDIPTDYTDLEITLAWLSFASGTDTLDIELSDDNGSSWEGPFEVSAALGSSGDRFCGSIRVIKAGGNAPTTAYKVIQSMILDTSLNVPEIRSYVEFGMSNPVNAVRLSGGTFDGAGGPVSVRTIR